MLKSKPCIDESSAAALRVKGKPESIRDKTVFILLDKISLGNELPMMKLQTWCLDLRNNKMVNGGDGCCCPQ